jgi:hypothetical protein
MLDLAEVGPAINGAELLVERGEGSEPKSPKYT